ncbi:hypothetical protein HSX11_08765 [Oxalobacteraceae bacterium]|nr:hypothetical protein [Oxalobacteraceae bacterium]
MDVVAEHVVCENDRRDSSVQLRRFRYPRVYTASTGHKFFFLMLCAALLLPGLLSRDEVSRVVFTSFAILVDLAYIAYAFGWKLSLYADRLEYQSCFFFKRSIRREQMLSWQLQIRYVKNAEVFSLVVKSSGKDFVFQIDFEFDAAIYAWFPQLQALAQERRFQFPGLQRISR